MVTKPHVCGSGLVFFFFFRFTKSLRWPANVAARFVFWLLFLKRLLGEKINTVLLFFYMTGGGAIHDNAHFLCIMFLLCVFMYHVRLLHWNINWEPGLVYVLCRVTFPCRHVTTLALRAPFFVARVIKTESFFYIKRTWHTRVMLTIILWFFSPRAAPNPGARRPFLMVT